MSMDYYQTVMHPLFRVTEKCGDFLFDMLRLKVSKRKITLSDSLGLVGLNSLDLSSDKCYLTEGVSDFIATKFMLQQGLPLPILGVDKECTNVLGVTTLSGNEVSRNILCSLFDKFVIITDNDTTGIMNVNRFRKFFVDNGKEVQVVLPDSGYKDICEQFCSIVKHDRLVNV